MISHYSHSFGSVNTDLIAFDAYYHHDIKRLREAEVHYTDDRVV